MDLTLVTKPGPDTEELDTGGLVTKHLTKKLQKIEHRIGGNISVRAVLTELNVGFEAAISVQGRYEIVGKAKEPELLRAVDAALDKITRQVETMMDRKSGKERARRASGQRRGAL
ncbi:MAG: HPF/RaiA family ribosome-associated protein [Myxococcales bacterium]|nr:HPF/RaiA family ribosome-associated protein [Myxococcales bacterium]